MTRVGYLLTSLCAVAVLALARYSWAEVHNPLSHHNNLMQNQVARKVLDRACAASKDTIDEIVMCFEKNENFIKHIPPTMASHCYEQTFHSKFDIKDFASHKDIICKDRHKFENMTSCIFRNVTDTIDPKHHDELVETLVEVGLCMVSALD